MFLCPVRLSGIFLRGLVLLVSCVVAWYVGHVLAVLIPPDVLSLAVSSIHKVALNSLMAAPAPQRQRCNLCPAGTFDFQLMSGGGVKVSPRICFKDEIIMGEGKDCTGRGINIAAFDASSGKVFGCKSFDMWEGDNSGIMVKFLREIPNVSIILMASYDDASTKLSEEVKEEIKKLGSVEIQNIDFRSSWVFVGSKGFSLPTDLQREKINHSDKSMDKYVGWPAEVQIKGCIPHH